VVLTVTRIILILNSLLLLTFTACNLSVSGGGGTDIEARTVSGIIRDKQNQPVACATVRLRPDQFIADSTSATNKYTDYNTTTDNSGRFTFSITETGAFSIEANRELVGAFVRCTVMTDDDTIPVAVIADSVGVLYGTVKSAEGDRIKCALYVYGTDKHTATDSAGKFSLRNMAPGTQYTIKAVPVVPTHTPTDNITPAIPPGGTQDMGTITVELTGCSDTICDTVSVRAILDANGLHTVPVNDVITVSKTTNRIEHLNLSDLNISKLPDAIGNLSALRTLSVANNSITKLPSTIALCTSLRELTLSNNAFLSVPLVIGSLNLLEVLSLDGNYILTLPDTLKALSRLRVMCLTNNGINTLPKWIGTLGNLEELYINGNSIATIPEEIGSLTKLRVFIAGSNKISSLPSSIGNWEAIRRLDCNDNSLTTLPSAIGNLVTLEYLLLNANQLASLPREITTLTNLTTLNVTKNKLTNFSSDIAQWIDTYSNDPNWRDSQE